MLRRARLAFVFLVAAGCGGGGGRADGGGGAAGSGSGGRDAGRDSSFNPFDAAVTGAAGTGATTGTAGVSGIDAAPVDRGMPNPGMSIYRGVEAFMLRFGPSCTEEAGATGDRWCAFVAASPTTANAADSYVFNATRAAAGTAITCGVATDTNCLKLTAAFAEDDSGAHGAFFQGDTLVYFDATATPFGWRPGMTAGRALAVANAMTGDVFGCVPAPKGTAIVCLKDQATQPTANVFFSDLLLGTLDGAATPPLAVVETVISFNAGDGDYPRFGYQFLSDAQTLAWSTRTSPTGPEILKTQKAGDAASRAMIGSDIHEWGVSPDGSHWTWFAQHNVNTGVGTLQSAPITDAAARVANGSNMVQYGFPAGRAVISVTAQGAMAGLTEPVTAPTATSAIDTGVLAFFDLGAQGDIGYAKNYDSTNDLTDMYIKRWNATGAACTLTSTPNGAYPAFRFTPSGAAAVWARLNASRQFELLLTRVSDCTTMQVSPPGAVYLDTSSDRAVIYLEGRDPVDKTTSLLFRPLTADGSAVGGDPVFVSSGVGGFAFVAAAPGALVYSINTGGTEDGIYVKSGP